MAGVLFTAVAASACAANDTAKSKSVREFMLEDLEPAAEVIWDSAGWILTPEGEQELWPTTDAGWAAVATAGTRIVELSETLAQPTYAEGLPGWAEFSEAMAVVAARAGSMAEAQDKMGLFDEGGHLYLACIACHERYMANHPR